MSEERSDGKANHPANEWWPKSGQRFWEARASQDVNTIFSTPANLWTACMEYFKWVEDNPIYAPETVKYMGQARLIPVPKMRIMTVTGLTLFLGVTRKTWYNYAERKDYDVVCEQVEQIMRDQQLSGASSDQLNPNIIARLLGLVDKQNVESKQTVDGKMKWEIEIVDPEDDDG